MKWFAHSRRSFNSINRRNRQRVGQAVSQVAKKAMGRSEDLESRRMLVNYTGTAGPDNFLVQVGGGNVTVTINGVPDIRTDAAVATIVIDALGGNDTINVINNTNNPTTINAGDGDDSITLGGGDYDTNITSAVVITDGTGTLDQLTFDDTVDGAGLDTYTMTAIRTFQKGASVTTTWSLINSIIVNGSGQASTWDVNTDAESGAVTLNGGAAVDTFNVGGALDLGNMIDTNLHINGAGGADVVTLDDTANVTATTYTLDANGLGSTRIGGTIRVSFASITNATLNGAPGILADTYNILDLNGVTNFTANAGDGNDTLNYGDGVADVNTVDVNVTFNGQAGTADRINFNGQVFAGSETYTVTSTTIDTSLTGVLTYGTTVESVVINADAGSTVFNVNSTSGAATMSINAGDGDDTVNVGAGDFTFNVNNDITVVGGAGNDLLNIDDLLDATARTWTYQFGSIGVPATTDTIFFSTLFVADATERVSLAAGTGADTINVPSTGINTDATLNGGGGNDTVNVANVAQDLDVIDGGMSIVGGLGSDSIVLSDDAETTADTYSFLSTGFTTTGMANSIQISSDVESGELNAGIGALAQTFNVASVFVATSLTLSCGDGNDAITIGGGDWANNIFPKVSVLAGAGADTLTVDDTNDDANSLETYHLAINSLIKDQTGATDPILWSTTLESLVVNTTQFADSIIVESTNNNTQVTFNGGAGNDTLDASDDNDIDLDIVGNVSFFGGADVDLLDLNDTGDTADADNYTINNTSFVKSSMPTGDVLWNLATETIALQGNAGAGVYTVGGVNDGTSLSVNAGGGSDTIQNDADNDFSFDWEDANITLSGGGGTDSLSLDDTNSATDTYGIDNNLITTLAAGLNGPVSVFYDLLESFNILTNGIASTINATGLDNEVANFTLNGGAGSDTINVGGASGADLDGLNFYGQASNISLAGGVGTDQLNIHDTDADVGNDVYELTETTFTVAFGGATPVVFRYNSDVNNLNITGSDLSHGWNIESTFSTTFVTLTGGAAADTFNMTTATLDIDNIDAPMTVVGGGGSDTMNVNDDNNAGNVVWTISSGFVDRTGGFFAGIRYSTLELVDVDAGTLGDTFNVTSTSSTTSYALDGNADNDIFNIASSNNMDLVDGVVTLLGGAGTDSVNYNDSLNAAVTTYTLGLAASQRVARTGAANIVVGVDNESVIVTTGSANNFINIDAWNALFPNGVTVNAGAGNDSITVGNGDYDTNIGTSITVNSGLGNDTLVFNDSTDNDTGDTYTVNASTIVDSGAPANVLTYGGGQTEELQLLLPGGNELVTFAGLGVTTGATVLGGNGDDTVDIGTGNVEVIGGRTVFFDGQAGSDQLRLQDVGAADADNWDYNILAAGIGQIINTNEGVGASDIRFTSVSFTTHNSGAPAERYNINGTVSAATINAGGGNDTLDYGGAANLIDPIDNLITWSGDANNDTVLYDDSGDAAGRGISLSSTQLTSSTSAGVNYFNSESVTINGGSGDDTLNINGTLAGVSYDVGGGLGNDLFAVTPTTNDIDASILASVTLGGGGGTDTVNYNDVSDVGADSYLIDVGDVLTKSSFGAGVAIDLNNVEVSTLNANNDGNLITVNAATTVLTINGNGGDDNMLIADGGTSANPIIVTSGAGADTVNVDSDNDAVEAFVRFAGTDEIARMVIGIGSTLRNGPGNSTLIVSNSISIGGALDVDAGFFIGRVGVGTAAAYNTVLTNGRNGGTWNGTNQAFSSSAATASARPDGLGIRLATDPNLAGANIVTFGGQAVNPGDTCIAYVQNGDTDLDRDVDFDDLLRVAQNFGLAAPRVWTQGSFDYDNDVDFDDLLSTAQNFGLPFLRVSTTDADLAGAQAAFAQASQQRGIPARASKAMQSVIKAMRKDESLFASSESIA